MANSGQGLSIALPIQSGQGFTAQQMEAIRSIIQDEISQRSKRLHLTPLHAEPNKPREGDVVFADGTDWDPGSGIGVYAYFSGTWNLL